MWCACAIAAIFVISQMPPVLQISGLTMSTARVPQTSRNSFSVYIASPVTTGMVVFSFTSLIAAMSSGGQGSSNQYGSSGSNRLATRIAFIGASRRCTSINRSTDGPTALRIADTTSTASFSASFSGYSLHGPGNGSNFRAVNPRVSTSVAAAWACSSGVLAPPDHPFAYSLNLGRTGPPNRS